MAATRIGVENALLGTRDWIITSAAVSREIEGFCSPSSVGPGGAVDVHVSTSAPEFRADVFRLGFYDNTGGRLVGSFAGIEGSPYQDPDADGRNARSCDWPASVTIPIGALDTATSGCYLVKLTAVGGPADGRQRYTSFVVRDDENPVDFTVHRADSTDAAYNDLIAPNLYATGTGRATATSYDRPEAQAWGGGLLLMYDLPNLYWLESQDIELGYVASADLHSDIRSLLRSRALVSLGHDEYWSYEMRANVEAAIDQGLSVAFLGANACYWQVRFEATRFGANRMMVCYKDAWELLPRDTEVATGDPRLTTTWRDAILGRPEQNLCGLMFFNYSGAQQPFVAKSTQTWPYTGSGASEGGAFADVMGYEVDRIMETGDLYAEVFGMQYTIDALRPVKPALLLGRSPYAGTLGNAKPADTALSTTRTGAKVFGTGTVGWGSALMEPAGGYTAQYLIPGFGYAPLQTLTRNILDNFRAGPLGIVGFDDEGQIGDSWTAQWGCSPVLQTWQSGARRVAVGNFTAPPNGRDEVALLRAPGAVGPQLGIFAFDASDAPAATAWIPYEGPPPVPVPPLLSGWLDANDIVLAGDFRGLGHDQLLFINNDGALGRLTIIDFTGGTPTQVFLEAYGTSTLLNGWHDPDDVVLAGDFRGLGHDQVLFINTDGAYGRVAIVDFSGATANRLFYEGYGTSALLDGWHDPGDLALVGDFCDLGHDQVAFINNSGTWGRLTIVDFSGTTPDQLYLEAYGASDLLNGWHDPGDLVLAGDFRGLGHDQLLFVNNGPDPSEGRVLTVDFSAGPTWVAIGHDDGRPLDGWRIAEFACAGRLLDGARDALLLLPY